MTLRQSVEQYCRRHGVAALDLKAALIDMDGTLYDSMPHPAAAWVRMMAEEDCPIEPETIFLLEGMTGPATINLLFGRRFGHGTTPEHAAELYARKAAYFAAMPPVGMIDGARDMIDSLLDHGLATVLVTGSAQGTTLGRLDSDFPGAFPSDRRVTARDVAHGKPDPEPYLKGMEIAGCRPCQAMVVDNAPLGVESGARSGAFTLGVTTGPVPVEALYEAGADYVFKSMRELASSLGELYSLCKPR